jgi:histidyl-tRNA synthetase
MVRFQRPRGTRDFSPEEMVKRRYVEDVLRESAKDFGFREVMTPTFEHTELFVERSGEGIVDEMYTFKDKGGRDLALRPELTAPVMRFYVNELQSRPKPLKVFYFGNIFRYERPQAGRFREFFQFGAELIGAPSVESDTEIIALALGCLRNIGLENVEVRIGHLGVLESLLSNIGLSDHMHPFARKYIDKKDYDGLEAMLAEQGISGTELGGLVELISIQGGRGAIAKAQDLVTEGNEAFSYLANILLRLSKYGFEDCKVDFGVARGLDYYNGMVFEIDSPSLGAEKQVCGGGAYKLAELFGGEEVNSTGFAFGFDRLMMAMDTDKVDIPINGIKAYIIPIGQSTRLVALDILRSLRQEHISADIDLMGRNISKALSYADSVRARWAVILGERELAENCVTLRDMESGDQNTVPLSEMVQRLEKMDWE